MTFDELFHVFDRHERAILRTYDAATRQGEIVFYGASNFRLWKTMAADMAPFVVQNHGFGGSTDRDLLERAPRLLFPYRPSIVVFQTGSNDCPLILQEEKELGVQPLLTSPVNAEEAPFKKHSGASLSEQALFKRVFARKVQLFETLHEALPGVPFVVISGILMPGRSEFDEITRCVNQGLRELAERLDYLYYVDAEAMTVDAAGRHLPEMFLSDGIHLTPEARRRWANDYIKPVLAQVMREHPER